MVSSLLGKNKVVNVFKTHEQRQQNRNNVCWGGGGGGGGEMPLGLEEVSALDYRCRRSWGSWMLEWRDDCKMDIR